MITDHIYLYFNMSLSHFDKIRYLEFTLKLLWQPD